MLSILGLIKHHQLTLRTVSGVPKEEDMSELDKYFIHIRQQEGKKRTFLACLNKRENSGWVKEVKENMMHCKQPEKNGNDERMT